MGAMIRYLGEASERDFSIVQLQNQSQLDPPVLLRLDISPANGSHEYYQYEYRGPVEKNSEGEKELEEKVSNGLVFVAQKKNSFLLMSNAASAFVFFVLGDF